MGTLLMGFNLQQCKLKVTTLNAQGIRLNSKQEMWTKRINTVTELFAKKEQKTESYYNTLSSNANLTLSSARSCSTGAALMNQLSGLTAICGANVLSNLPTINDSMEAKDLASTISQVVNTVQSAVASAIDSAKEYALAELEAQEDAQLDPLQEKDTEIDAKVAANEILTTLAEANYESAKSKMPERVQDSVAHFGLQG